MKKEKKKQKKRWNEFWNTCNKLIIIVYTRWITLLDINIEDKNISEHKRSSLILGTVLLYIYIYYIQYNGYNSYRRPTGELWTFYLWQGSFGQGKTNCCFHF